MTARTLSKRARARYAAALRRQAARRAADYGPPLPAHLTDALTPAQPGLIAARSDCAGAPLARIRRSSSGALTLTRWQADGTAQRTILAPPDIAPDPAWPDGWDLAPNGSTRETQLAA